MHAVFIPGSEGRLFTVYHPPAGGRDLGDIVPAPPLPEGLNRSRPMTPAPAPALPPLGWGRPLSALSGAG